jgi:hypothetical protein
LGQLTWLAVVVIVASPDVALASNLVPNMRSNVPDRLTKVARREKSLGEQ